MFDTIKFILILIFSIVFIILGVTTGYVIALGLTFLGSLGSSYFTGYTLIYYWLVYAFFGLLGAMVTIGALCKTFGEYLKK